MGWLLHREASSRPLASCKGCVFEHVKGISNVEVNLKKGPFCNNLEAHAAPKCVMYNYLKFIPHNAMHRVAEASRPAPGPAAPPRPAAALPRRLAKPSSGLCN